MVHEWTKEEISKLKKLYPIMLLKELPVFFPKRSKGTIAVKALGLKLASAKLWQPPDNRQLKKKFANASEEELTKLFPRRSWSAILAQGERLGLKRIRNKPKLAVNENYFRKWSPNMAYILGFTMADGCIIKGTYSGYSDSLKFGVQIKDRDILEKIKREFSADHSISIVRNAAHFSISSQKLVDSLKLLGITYQKSLKEPEPNVPKKFEKDFIRGMIDGDGGISIDSREYPTLRLCGGIKTVRFVRDHFWKKFGAFSTLGRRSFSLTENCYLYDISYRSSTAKKIIDYLYTDASLFLDRKYAQAIKCKSINIRQKNNSTYVAKRYTTHSG